MWLVQLHMSKQVLIASVLGDGLLAESEAACLQLRCLRSNATMHASPKKAPSKKASNSSQSNKLFSPPTCMQDCRGAGGEDELDTVQRAVYCRTGANCLLLPPQAMHACAHQAFPTTDVSWFVINYIISNTISICE